MKTKIPLFTEHPYFTSQYATTLICPSCAFEPISPREKYCPLCRVSLAHKQFSQDVLTVPRTKAPIEWNEGKQIKVRVRIGGVFTGKVVGETTTHFRVTWVKGVGGVTNSTEQGELFAKNSKEVQCELM